jgi:hypothetical protein
METAYDAGAELFKRQPDLLLVEVHHAAPAKDYHEFVRGYTDARRRKDEYEQEKK